MAPQSYNVVNAHAHEILGCTISSILLYTCAPHIGGTNSDFQYDLDTLVLNNGEQIKYFHRKIIRLQQ